MEYHELLNSTAPDEPIDGLTFKEGNASIFVPKGQLVDGILQIFTAGELRAPPARASHDVED